MSPAATGEALPGAPESTYVHIGPERIDPRALYHEARHRHAGGIAQFSGVVRDHNRGARVVAIEYEAYAEMAEPVVAAIIHEAFQRWPFWRASAVHRTGELAIGDVAVCVTVSASHRDPAFAACRSIIDRLKAEAPIWKRETLESGEHRWLEEHRPPGTHGDRS